MPEVKSLQLRFPLAGVERRSGYNDQAPHATPAALNVWPTQWDTGRERGGSRPGLNIIGSGSVGEPRNWCVATWSKNTSKASGVHREIAVTTASGTYTSNGPGNWVSRIGVPSGGSLSELSSCAVYQQVLYQTSIDGTLKAYDLANGGPSYQVEPPSGWSQEDKDSFPVPVKCGIAVAWGDRLVLGQNYDDPHVLYVSRIGDARDWDYTQVDQSAAWASSGAEGGMISEPITSLIPHNRDCLLVGCTDSLWVLRGNPAAGGQAYVISTEVGPLGQQSWCRTGNDFLLMLTRDGLYQMPPGCGDPPSSLSREKLPAEMVGLSPEDGDYACLGYDHRWRGVHIYVRRANGVRSSWFFDLQTGGFWPMSLSPDIRLCPVLRRAANSTMSAILPMSVTGTTHQYQLGYAESFDSFYWYGPIKLAGPHESGQVIEVRSVLSTGSDRVSWAIKAGPSAQDAWIQTGLSFVGADWDRTGLNYAQHPKVGGNACYLKVETAGTKRLSLDEVTMLIRSTGRRRQ